MLCSIKSNAKKSKVTIFKIIVSLPHLYKIIISKNHCTVIYRLYVETCIQANIFANAVHVFLFTCILLLFTSVILSPTNTSNEFFMHSISQDSQTRIIYEAAHIHSYSGTYTFLLLLQIIEEALAGKQSTLPFHPSSG